MNSEKHKKIKDIFLRAIEIDNSEREMFLNDVCGGDTEILSEVKELLKNHNDDPIFEIDNNSKTNTPQVKEEIGRLEVIKSDTTIIGSSIISTIFASKVKKLFVLFSTIVGLIVIGVTLHNTLKNSLLSLKGNELKTIVASNAQALNIWVEGNKRFISAIAAFPEIIQNSEKLNNHIQNNIDKDSLINTDENINLNKLFKIFLKETSSENFYIISKDGTFISSSNNNAIGKKLSKSGVLFSYDVFDGIPKFNKPQNYLYWTNDSLQLESNQIIVFSSPIFDSLNNVIASINFTYKTKDDFSKMLEVGEFGKTGETYAFDNRKILLTESRFTKSLKKKGLIPEKSESATLETKLIIPNKVLSDINHPQLDKDIEQATVLVANAINAQEKGYNKISGTITIPYQNYRGEYVIGSWRWIPKYGIAIATEISITEAFEPLFILDIIFFSLIVLITILIAFGLFSSYSIVKLKTKVGEAMDMGQYKLERKIGEGGVGEVYLASHGMLKRPTAIKILKKELTNDETIRRFEREVQLVSHLSHPNTIQIFDYGKTPEGVLYYAMEYLDGANLQEIIEKNDKLNFDRTLDIIIQICGSLKEAHSVGLVHRDIKPMNIIISPYGGIVDFVKVLDFGLVKSIYYTEDQNITRVSEIAGTPIYMSPERFKNPRIVDTRSDIYSLGVLTYYLLTGKQLYQFNNDLDLIYQVLNEKIELSNIKEFTNLPPKFVSTLESMLEKDIDKRIKTISEVLDIFNQIKIDKILSEQKK